MNIVMSELDVSLILHLMWIMNWQGMYTIFYELNSEIFMICNIEY